MIRGIALFAAATLALGLGTAVAQDYTLPPINGAIKLNAGFTPDPYTIDVQAGGDVDAGAAISCAGFVSAAPALRLFYTAGDAPLRFSVVSDTDTTLIINDPDGNWNCNDDTNGINPEVAFDVPLEGQYDIWVGTYSSTGTITATLEISGAAAGGLNYELDPLYGEVELKGGFTPDPQMYEIDAGGPVNVEDTPGTEGACWGYATAEPTLRLQYEPSGFPLYIYALAEDDTVLIVNAPDGTWLCADDTGEGNDPVVTFDTPLAGQYDIWVGTYGGGTTPATLYISEVAAGPGTEAATGGLNWELTPLFGEDTLPPGFGTQTVDVEAGGTISPADLGEACVGFVTEAPTYRIFYDGTAPLTFNVTGGGDTQLVIADPDGTWFCNDDANGTLDPEIAFGGYGGQYDVWVGTFAGDGTTAPATLTITEGEGGAVATGQLDWALEPRFGAQTLETGFLPDPFTIDVEAGGDIDANVALGDDNCWGYVTAEPTFRLNYTAGTYPLAFWIQAADDADTTLIISDPNGDWFCSDDDAGGWNPGIVFDAPLTGQYDIWVGDYDGLISAATLLISETTNPLEGFDSPPIVSEPPPPSLPPVEPVGTLDPAGIPLFGEISLNAGFSPDPTTVDVMAGGPVQGIVAAEACTGYVSAEPTARLTYAAAAWPLILSAVSEADTTIIVRAPDGTFLCDDDTNGANPVVRIEQPAAGTYEIWVGTYSPGPTQAATLFISEISGGP